MSGYKNETRDDGRLGKYFHALPNMADDDLDPYQYRLYGHYKRVCGVSDDGACWESTRTTATNTKMSVGKVAKSRRELETLGYVNIEERGTNSLRITLSDVMPENIARFSKRSPHEHGVHHMNDSVHDMKQRRTKEKEPNKKKDSLASDDAGRGLNIPSESDVLAFIETHQPTNTTKLVAHFGRGVQMMLQALINTNKIRDTFEGYRLPTSEDTGKSDVQAFIETQRRVDAQPDWVKAMPQELVPMLDAVCQHFEAEGWKAYHMTMLLLGRAKEDKWKRCNLLTPFTVEDVKNFTAHYRSTVLNGDATKTIVQNPEGLQSAAMTWQKQNKPTAAANDHNPMRGFTEYTGKAPQGKPAGWTAEDDARVEAQYAEMNRRLEERKRKLAEGTTS